MVYLLIFLLGITIGSFLNVLIYRLPNNLSILGRSFCPGCKKKVSWYDNIPLISFINLAGKCRQCHSPISFYYPIVELSTGVLFAFIAWKILPFSLFTFHFSLFLQLIFILYVVSSLIVVFFVDLKYGIIPNKIVNSSVIISLLVLFTSEEPCPSICSGLSSSEVLVNHIFSAFGAFLFLLLLFLITRGKGMGFGDVKLSFLMGLFLGFPKIVVAFYIAFLTGALVSLILVLWGKKKFKGGTIAFGPFLVLGTLVSFFIGESIMQKFFSLFVH